LPRTDIHARTHTAQLFCVEAPIRCTDVSCSEKQTYSRGSI